MRMVEGCEDSIDSRRDEGKGGKEKEDEGGIEKLKKLSGKNVKGEMKEKNVKKRGKNERRKELK